MLINDDTTPTTLKSFIAPLPIFQPPVGNPMITITATLNGMTITLTDTDIIGKDSRSRTYQITAQDDESFIIPSDLAQSTQNMLIGGGQRMMYLKRYGFDREP